MLPLLPISSDELISVIIPTFNRSHTLPRALESVLAQSLKPNEIIVVDNNSPDDTKNLITEQYPDVIYMSEKTPGVSAARNTGIKRASSNWIALLDSDDIWLPPKLETQIQAYRESNQSYRLIHTNEIWYRNGKHINQLKKHQKRGGYIFEHCLSLCCISPSSVLLKRELFDDIGYFDQSLPVCEDYDLWLRVTAQESVLYIKQPLTIKHGGHPDQLSKRFWAMDRFRIQSLEKIITTSTLTKKQITETKQMLLKKLNIVVNGAVKRENQELTKKYSEKLNYWANFGD